MRWVLVLLVAVFAVLFLVQNNNTTFFAENFFGDLPTPTYNRHIRGAKDRTGKLKIT